MQYIYSIVYTELKLATIKANTKIEKKMEKNSKVLVTNLDKKYVLFRRSWVMNPIFVEKQ